MTTDNNGCNEFISVNENDLKKQSIFILPYEQEKGNEQDADRDFEFFVFVDPDDDNKCPDFLKELKNCLINCEWENGKPVKAKDRNNFFAISDHEQQLRKWLGDEVDSSLITPLNWLKIAIERYPYRLFVVINSSKWTNGDGHSPLDDAFWFDGNAHSAQPSEWKKSLFLYKRICWVEKNKFKSEKNIISFISEHWYEYIRKIKAIKEDLKVFIDRSGPADDDSELVTISIEKSKLRYCQDLLKKDQVDKKDYDNIGKLVSESIQSREINRKTTLPIKCFESLGSKKSDDTLEIPKSLIFTENRSDANILFIRHKESILELEQKRCYFFTNLSGSQFQLSCLLYDKPEKIYINIVEASFFNIGFFDERFVEWWEELSDNKDKVSVLYNRLFPIYSFKERKIGKTGCKLANNTLALSFPSENLLKGFENNKTKPDILIIHQTLWEALSLSVSDLLALKDDIPYIVITSGRGKPFSLPKGTKFMPFSIIDFFLLKDYPEKFLFQKNIMSLREESNSE